MILFSPNEFPIKTPQLKFDLLYLPAIMCYLNKSLLLLKAMSYAEAPALGFPAD